jgi:hypothetical protein
MVTKVTYAAVNTGAKTVKIYFLGIRIYKAAYKELIIK